MTAHFVSRIAADMGNDERDRYADAEVGRQRKDAQSDLEITDVNTHRRLHEESDADG